VSKRKKGSDFFGWDPYSNKKSDFGFGGVKGASSARSLARPMPWHQKFRPDQLLKDFSLLFDYNYASMWTRWRRGYELYMYAQQAYVGLNYSFTYSVSGQAGSGGASIPGICYMYPSTKQDMAMRMVVIRPRDSFNFLDFGFQIVEVFPWDVENQVYGVRLSENFGAPIALFYGEVLSDRFDDQGNPKTTFGNYTVVGVGTKAFGPNPPNFAPIQDSIFISVTTSTSWDVIENQKLKAPASLPVVGHYFSTAMRTGCNCPDYLGRDDFNLYKYAQRRNYPFTSPQDLKPGTYDPGAFADQEDRPLETRDNPGYTRDFGFLYLKDLLGLPEYKDGKGDVYSDPNLFFYQPRFCKHIYASWWDLQNRFAPDNFQTPYLAQPTDEPLDERYREYFYINLQKQTDFYNRNENLQWWETYSPSKDDTPTHMMYPDMYPTVAKVLNFGTLASGNFGSVVASGFDMQLIQDFNPISPIRPDVDIEDGGTYASGAPTSSGSVRILDGGEYINGAPLPPFFRPFLNGGTY